MEEKTWRQDAGSKGGKVSALLQKEEAAKLYWESPKICKYCLSPIPITSKPSEARRKTFCNRSCSTSFNNKKRAKPNSSKKKERFLLENLSKQELKTRYDNVNNMHSTIRQHSRRVFEKSGKDKKCHICGYDYHVDICHIKDIKDFAKETTMKKMNEISNLVPLCKNHHHEFDNGLINLEDKYKKSSNMNRFMNKSSYGLIKNCLPVKYKWVKINEDGTFIAPSGHWDIFSYDVPGPLKERGVIFRENNDKIMGML